MRFVGKNDDANTIYLLAKEWDYTLWQEKVVLHKSTDKGETFQQALNLSSLMTGSFDIWTPRYSAGAVFLFNDGALYRVNANDQLTPVSDFYPAGTGNSLLTGRVENGEVFLYARVDDHIYFSGDSGISWADKGSVPCGTFSVNSFNASNTSPDHLFIGGIEVFRSDNGAGSWQRVNNWWEYYGYESSRLHVDIPEIRVFPAALSADRQAAETR